MRKILFLIASLLTISNTFGQNILKPSIEPFSKLAIVGSFDVEIVQGETESVVLESDKVDLNDVTIIQENGFLKIKTSKSVFNKELQIRAKISFKNLTLIRLNAGTKIIAIKPLQFNELEIDANNGAALNIPLVAEKIVTEVGQGATVSLEGTCKELEIQADNGGLFNAYELKSEKALAQANTGAIVKVWAVNELEAKVIMGGQVSYRGQPKEFKKSNLFGGSVEMLIE